MAEIELPALSGTNPLGLFAALGALDVATRALGGPVTLRWTDSLEPTAILRGPDSLDQLVDLIDTDRDRWVSSPILTWGPGSKPLTDLKPSPNDLRSWFQLVLEEYRHTGDRTDIDLMSGLVAEGAVAGKGDSKPTHFHFTAGQQRFLTMVRELHQGLDAGRIREALAGPWRYDSRLPVLGWDTRGERIYALRGFNPSSDKKLGVPGADWLGFLGLRFFPVAVRSGRSGKPQLITTGCSPGWKTGDFTWPLWVVDLSAEVIGSVLGDRELIDLTPTERLALGISEVLRVPIRRTDQGGYGSFGPPGPARSRGRRATDQA
ncbi:hypothetical protein BH24ACT9_BH24ACT9_12690 [soil metagenome]